MFIGVRMYECVRVSGVCGVCLRVWLFMCIYVCVRACVDTCVEERENE